MYKGSNTKYLYWVQYQILVFAPDHLHQWSMVPKYDHYLEYKQLNTQLDPSSSVWKTICHLLEQSYHRNYCQTLFVVRKRLLPIHKLRSHMPTKVTLTSMSEEVAHYESTTEKYCNGLKVKTLKWLVAILLKIMTMEHPRSLNSAPFYCTVCSIWKSQKKVVANALCFW